MKRGLREVIIIGLIGLFVGVTLFLVSRPYPYDASLFPLPPEPMLYIPIIYFPIVFTISFWTLRILYSKIKNLSYPLKYFFMVFLICMVPFLVASIFKLIIYGGSCPDTFPLVKEEPAASVFCLQNFWLVIMLPPIFIMHLFGLDLYLDMPLIIALVSSLIYSLIATVIGLFESWFRKPKNADSS